MRTKFRKMLTFTLISIVVIASLRILWFSYHTNDEISVTIEQGVVDLSHYDTLKQKHFKLTGDWAFVPDQFVDPASPMQTGTLLPVTEDWNELVTQEEQGSYGKGSYQLLIKLPQHLDHDLSFRFFEIFSAASFYMNGEHVLTYNELDHTSTDKWFTRGPVRVDVPALGSEPHPDQRELHVVAHVSNYQFPPRGGITGAVHFGDKSTIDAQAILSNTMQIVVAFTFLLHAIYSFTLFVMTKEQQRINFLLFAIILVLFGLGILFDDEVVIQLPLSILDANRVLIVIFTSTLFAMYTLSGNIFNIKVGRTKRSWIYFVISCLLSLLLPGMLFVYWVGLISVIIFSVAIFMIVQSIRSIRAGHDSGYFILLFVLAYLSNSFWGLLIKGNIVQVPFYPLDYLFSMVFIMILFIRQHAQTVEENKVKTEKIMQNERKKDEFLATTAHELRNPLQGIIVIIESILSVQKNELTAKTRKDLVLTLEVAYNMKYTLNDLQDISRLNDHEIELKLKNVNLHSIVSNVVEMFQLRMKEKPVKIVSDISADFPLVKADAQRLFQVIFNLVNNAFKFTFEGFIRIAAQQKNGTVQLSVQDSGIGIPEEELSSITKPYEQGSNIRSHNNQGVGLGLSISKQLIHLHGGKFWIESELEKGTTVSFTLKLADEQVEEEQAYRFVVYAEEDQPVSDSVAARLQTTGQHEKDKIIVIDDDPINLTAIEMALSPDYELTILDDPTTLFTLDHLNQYSLVISDVMMPQMSGFDLTRKLRKQFSITDLPVLLLTALNHPSNIGSGFSAGANDYVSKPVERAVLRSRVETLVRLRHAVKEKVATEAAWLQAQIKPHFLFNTLNSIASLSETDSDEMVELIHQFGNYLSRSFNILSTNELVSLEDEIETVKSYLYIQMKRFPDQFSVCWDVQTSIDRIMIPPFVLQTIVENAIEHGVLRTEAAQGEIVITIRERDGRAVVSIEDNGPGIEASTLEKILNGKQVDGIGLRNSNQRLRSFHHTGLKIERVKPYGTIVSFELPMEQGVRV